MAAAASTATPASYARDYTINSLVTTARVDACFNHRENPGPSDTMIIQLSRSPASKTAPTRSASGREIAKKMAGFLKSSLAMLLRTGLAVLQSPSNAGAAARRANLFDPDKLIFYSLISAND